MSCVNQNSLGAARIRKTKIYHNSIFNVIPQMDLAVAQNQPMTVLLLINAVL